MQPELKACAGHHWPGEGRVDFVGETRGEVAELEGKLVATLKAAIQQDHGVTAFLNQDGKRKQPRPVLRPSKTGLPRKEGGTFTTFSREPMPGPGPARQISCNGGSAATAGEFPIIL